MPRKKGSGIPASGIPASGMPATGAGWGGPARGASTAPPLDGTLQPTSQQRLDAAAMRALAREHAAQAIGTLAAIMADPKHPRAIDAADRLLTRGFGAPPTGPAEAPGENTLVTEVVYRWARPAEAPTPGGDDA
jgi:hypothetical protein